MKQILFIFYFIISLQNSRILKKKLPNEVSVESDEYEQKLQEYNESLNQQIKKPVDLGVEDQNLQNQQPLNNPKDLQIEQEQILLDNINQPINQQNLDKKDEEEINQQLQKKSLFQPVYKKGKADSCNVDLIKSVGITISQENIKDNTIQPRTADKNVKSLCKRLRGTCCSANEILTSLEYFQTQADQLRDYFKTLEQLFTLFRGPKVHEFFRGLKENDQCLKQINDFKYFNSATNDTLNFENFLVEVQENIEGNFLSMRRYRKHTISNYANMVCTVCNPTETQFFTPQKENLEVKINIQNCAEMMDLVEFENNVARTFQNYLTPIYKVLQCNEDLAKTWKIDEINTAQIEKNQIDMESCFDDFGINNEKCINLCSSKNLKDYKFPGNLYEVASSSFEMWFELLVGYSIGDFYKKFYKNDYKKISKQEDIKFLPDQEKTKSEIDLKKMKLTWVDQGGISITNDYMARRYLENNLQIDEQDM